MSSLVAPNNAIAASTGPEVTGEMAALQAVWERINTRIEQHLRPVEVAIARLLEEPLGSGDEQREVLDELGALSGWLGDLGMVSAARLARQLNRHLDEPAILAGPDVDLAVVAAGLVDDLRSSVTTTGGENGLLGSLGDHLLVVGPPNRAVDGLTWCAVTSGFTVQHVSRLAGWPDETDAVVVFAEDNHSMSATSLSCRSAVERYPDTPLLVVGSLADPRDRFELSRYATSMMAPSSRPVEVLHEVRRSVYIARRIDQVAVHGENAATIAADLDRRNIAAWVAQDARDLFGGLDAGRANAVVLAPADSEAPVDSQADPDASDRDEHDAPNHDAPNHDAPNHDAPNHDAPNHDAPNYNARLVRAIRAQPSTRRTVIVEMVRDQEPSTRVGVDMALTPSADGDAWIEGLRSLMRRKTEVDADLATTSRTGGVPWASAKFLAERLLLGVHRANAVASLCVIRYDDQDPTSEVDAVQELLQQDFRSDDIVTRSADRETILLLGGLDRSAATARLQNVVERLASVGARVGIAEFPYDAQSVDDLVSEARSALQRSAAEAGPVVVTADWHPGDIVAYDVIIADSDEAVAQVVADALERCGLSVHHVSDGQALLDRLQDPSVRLPKLLLLEFDLLSVDGLTVLRRLRRQAALRRFAVVMLSARTRETDIRQAYDLGVTEVMSKPFSPGILVRRLLRILEIES